MSWEYQLEAIGLVTLAGFVGAIVGLEREFAGKPAGLRTHIMVAASSALMMVIGEAVMEAFRENNSDSTLSADPIRVIHAILIGVSFLGAGTIIHQGGHRVEGLTTASSIFFTAGLGMGIAARQFVLAGGLTLLSLVVLYGIGWAEQGLSRYHREPEPSHDESGDEDSAAQQKSPKPSAGG